MKRSTLIIRVVAGLLVGTSVLKLLDLADAGRHPYFSERDPLFSCLSNLQVVLAAALFELGIAAAILTRKSGNMRALVLLWFSGIVSMYKLGLTIGPGVERPCSCLGVLGRVSGLSHAQLDLVTWGLLLFLTAAALFIVLADRAEAARTMTK